MFLILFKGGFNNISVFNWILFLYDIFVIFLFEFEVWDGNLKVIGIVIDIDMICYIFYIGIDCVVYWIVVFVLVLVEGGFCVQVFQNIDVWFLVDELNFDFIIVSYIESSSI